MVAAPGRRRARGDRRRAAWADCDTGRLRPLARVERGSLLHVGAGVLRPPARAAVRRSVRLQRPAVVPVLGDAVVRTVRRVRAGRQTPESARGGGDSGSDVATRTAGVRRPARGDRGGVARGRSRVPVVRRAGTDRSPDDGAGDAVSRLARPWLPGRRRCFEAARRRWRRLRGRLRHQTAGVVRAGGRARLAARPPSAGRPRPSPNRRRDRFQRPRRAPSGRLAPVQLLPEPSRVRLHLGKRAVRTHGAVRLRRPDAPVRHGRRTRSRAARGRRGVAGHGTAGGRECTPSRPPAPVVRAGVVDAAVRRVRPLPDAAEPPVLLRDARPAARVAGRRRRPDDRRLARPTRPPGVRDRVDRAARLRRRRRHGRPVRVRR